MFIGPEVGLEGVERLQMHFDAGVRGGNPGVGGIAVWAYLDEDHEIGIAEHVGDHVSTNQAEWMGLIKALELCRDYGHDLVKLALVSDSKLVVMQALSEWKTRGHLTIYKLKATTLCQELLNRGVGVSIEHVRREYNKPADALVTDLLDRHTGKVRQNM
jgi:ribonuclease HI